MGACFKKIKKLFSRKKRIVIYTAITGNYDALITPEHINEDYDYICFTDNPALESNFWQIREMEASDLDDVRKARRYKVLPHVYLPEYDFSVWVDGNFEIVGDVEEYIKEYSKQSPMLCIVHPDRDCAYEEAQACIDQGKDADEIIQSQMERYTARNYPRHSGMIASGILFRKHGEPDVIKVMNDWWAEIESFSRRDQLSFNYVCWKNNFCYDESDLSCWGNQYFRRVPHTSKKKKPKN